MPHADICTLGYHTCHPNATCTVDSGGSSTSCACNPGFTGDGLNCTMMTITCGDITCGTNAACHEVANNLPQCVCNQGYVGDGVNCTMTCGGVICSPNAHCGIVGDSELPRCVCNADFEGDGLMCSQPRTNCSGVLCDRNAICDVVNEVLRCVCKTGFRGDGSVCTRIDPCERIGCDPHAMCVANANSQQPATAQCVCNAGFTGDGRVCASLAACNATCLSIQTNLHCIVLENVIECTSPRVQQLFETVSHIKFSIHHNNYLANKI